MRAIRSAVDRAASPAGPRICPRKGERRSAMRKVQRWQRTIIALSIAASSVGVYLHEADAVTLSPNEQERVGAALSARKFPEVSRAEVDAGLLRTMRGVPIVVDQQGLGAGYVVAKEG